MFDKPFGFYFLLFIILTLFFKFYAIIEGFVPAITTACVLAYLSQPVYNYLVDRTSNRSISAFIVLFGTFTLILVPLTFIGLAVQQQVQFLLSMDTIEYVRSMMQEIDGMLLERFNVQFFDKYLQDLVTPLMSAGQEGLKLFVPKMIMSMTSFILSIFITFFIMYYLLLNADQVIKIIRYYGPLNDENMDDLLTEMGKDTKTLILGQLLVATLQGTLTAIGFLIFGVPAVILWGMVAVITSFLPVLGAGVVWFPGCIYLFAQQRYFAAVGLLLWGAIVVSTSDNIVRPKLVNMLGEIHPVTVLLGVFIGIKEWGLIGIVLGPLLISVLITLIKMFREQFLDEA